MANEYFKKKMIMQRHGNGFRPYPFSFVEIINPLTNVVIGSGLMPDNQMAVNYVPKISDYDGEPQVSANLEIDPSWIYNDTRATGIK